MEPRRQPAPRRPPRRISSPQASRPATPRRSSRSCRPDCGHARRTCAGSTCSGSPTSSGPGRPATRRTTSSPTASSGAPCASHRTISTRRAGSPRSRSRAIASPSRSHSGGRALAISPTTARNYGVVGDAQLELGRYQQAFAAFDTMARLKPGVSSYARIAYARELLGSLDGARSALLLARDAAADEREPLAWTETQLGKLELSRGRLNAASAHLLAGAPDLPRLRLCARRARAGRARARPPTLARRRSSVARSRRSRCRSSSGCTATCCTRPATSAQRASSTRPRTASAGCWSRTACAPTSRPRSSTSTTASGCGARSRWPGRRSASGRRSTATTCSPGRSPATAAAREALHYSKLALRLGTKDTAKLFHRAEIERCLGHDPRPWARAAIALNPHFSLLWTSTLRRLAS